MSLSLAENVIVAGADNRPPMLDKTNYSSWACRMLLYIIGKEHGKLLVDLVLNEPFQYGTMVEPENETTPATIRARTYTDLTDEEKIHESVDIKATNIVLQGSELSLQERESKLYDDFDTFTSMLGETIHSYYMWFAQLINDMHTIGMIMKPLQVNTKFVNHLQPKWSKFVTDVKLAKDMHTINFDHLYAHLRQHEAHANEVRLARQRYPDQTALVANSPSCLNPTQYYPQLSSASQQYYPSYAPQSPAIQQSSSIELDLGLVIPSFNPSDDPISNLNKLMAFVTIAFGPRFPQTNNQLRTSSNPRNQATIQDGRVIVQTVQGRQTQGAVKCYNCQEEGHFDRQCTKPKRPKNSAWFKEKLLLTEALESGAYLDPEQLTFLADNGDTVVPAQAYQEIPTPVAFQTDDLDAFDSDCDDIPSAKAVLMANLSSYDSDVLSVVPFHDTNIENARRKVPTLYDANTIVKTHVALSVTDSEETLELAEKSRKQLFPPCKTFLEVKQQRFNSVRNRNVSAGIVNQAEPEALSKVLSILTAAYTEVCVSIFGVLLPSVGEVVALAAKRNILVVDICIFHHGVVVNLPRTEDTKAGIRFENSAGSSALNVLKFSYLGYKTGDSGSAGLSLCWNLFKSPRLVVRASKVCQAKMLESSALESSSSGTEEDMESLEDSDNLSDQLQPVGSARGLMSDADSGTTVWEGDGGVASWLVGFVAGDWTNMRGDGRLIGQFFIFDFGVGCDASVLDSDVSFEDCFLLSPLLAPGFLPWGTSSVCGEGFGALESTGTSKFQMAFMWVVKGGSLGWFGFSI
ncbi:integrase, catalytic region, zinc finger, CCHC-type containing protein [Tanacetum coccineum]